MSTSRYSPVEQAHRRATRLAVSADAWHYQPDQEAGGSRLDVPLSVSVAPDTGTLIADLAEDVTPPDGAVALCGLIQAAPTAATGRGVVVFADRHHIADANSDSDSDRIEVQVVTPENLANRLVSMPGRFGLVAAMRITTRGEGFWSAAHRGLAQQGFLAVVTSSLNPKSHADLYQRASAQGFVYLQHIVAVSGDALNRAVTATHVPPGARRVMRHRRVHRNVFVFQRSQEAS